MKKNKLYNFRKKNKLKLRQLSELTGVDLGNLWQYERGMRLPGLESAFKIEDATLGEIPARYWIKLKLKKHKK